MPKLCAACRYWTADEAQAACPFCSAALSPTLLPPPGQDPDPVRHLPEVHAFQRRRANLRSDGSGEFFAWLARNPLWIAGGMIALAVFLSVLSIVAGHNRGAVREKYERITSGMTESEVRQVLATAPGEAIDRSRTHPSTVPDRGPGVLTHSEETVTIRVEFENGRVVRKSHEGLD